MIQDFWQISDHLAEYALVSVSDTAGVYTEHIILGVTHSQK